MKRKTIKTNEVRETVSGVPFFEIESSLHHLINNLKHLDEWLTEHNYYDAEIVNGAMYGDAFFEVVATRKKTKEEIQKEIKKRAKAKTTRINTLKKQIDKIEKELKRLL